MIRTVNIVGLSFVLFQSIADAVTIQMNTSISGQSGSNGTKLICTFNKLKDDIFYALNFRRNDTIVSINAQGKIFSSDGKYLEGRVLVTDIINTFTNETNEAFEAMMIYTNLQCIDGGNYSCELTYGNSNNNLNVGKKVSRTASLMVKAPPSQPTRFFYLKNDVQNIDTTTIQYNETVSNGYDATSPSSAINNSDNIITEDNQTFLEGDNITLFCEVSIGKPPSNVTLQKHLSNDARLIISSTEIPTEENPENCSFYQNITAIMSLSAEDNEASFQCMVGDWNKSTGPINVKYPVLKPNITKEEPGGSNLYITLRCSSNGNPAPVYSWFWAEKTSHPNHWEHRSNTRNVTFNITEEGIYRCDVYNTFAGETFNESSNYTYTAITKQTKPIMVTSGGPETSKLENNNKIYYVIGGVAGGAIMIIILVVVIVKCRGNRTKAPTMQQKKSSSGDGSGGFLVHQPSKRQTTDANNYCSVSLDDEVGRGSNVEQGVSTQEETRKHNEKYLKEQNEKDSRNEDRGGHQPVEYAMVNKSFKGRSRKQLNDQHQPTEYAQVNKVQKKTTNKPPQDEGHYASGQGVYDHANDRRHKRTTESDPYDTPSNINRRGSDKVGSVVEITGEAIKQKQVAKVKPSGRFGYENAGMIPDDVIKKKEELNTEL